MHPNEKLIREMFADYFAGGEQALAERSLDPNVVWRVVSLGEISGAYRGRESVLAFLNQVVERSQYLLTEIVSIAANDDVAVTIFRNSAVYSEEGRTDHEEVWVQHFKNGRIVEVWDYHNLIHEQMIEEGERNTVGY